MPDQPSAIVALLERVRHEGPILGLGPSSIGIFDPLLALEIDAANTEGLRIAPRGIGVFGRTCRHEGMAWSDIRAILIAQSRRLGAPHHLKALHGRMLDLLAADSGPPADLTQLVGRALSQALIPMVIDGTGQRAVRTLAADQSAKFRRLLDARAGKTPVSQRVACFVKEVAAGRAVARHLRRRRAGKAPAQEDFAQTLLGLTGRIGPTRTSYLVMTLLTAISSAPGAVGACILHALLQRPEWSERIRLEFERLGPGELYTLPLARLPHTMRFIKEAMRLWTFPLVTRRIASRDLKVGRISVGKGSTFDLSAYLMHHSELYWERPELFDPDRWRRSGKPANMKGTYVPFGFAPRACIGASIGQGQLLLFCDLVTRALDIALSPGRTPRIDLQIMAIPVDLVGTVRRRTA